MLVILKRVFFCGGNRYRSIGKSAVEIPDKFKDILPEGAVIVDANNNPIVDEVDAKQETFGTFWCHDPAPFTSTDGIQTKRLHNRLRNSGGILGRPG